MKTEMTAKEQIDREDGRIRLKALIEMFSVTTSQIAKVAQISRPMVSRVLHGDSGVNPQYLYSRLEKNLSKLIDLRQKPFFTVEAVELESVIKASRSLKSAMYRSTSSTPLP